LSAIAAALLNDLGPEHLAVLAERLAPYLTTAAPAEDEWMDTKEAAAYLGLTVKALHHKTAAGLIPCHRESDAKGAKCWFLKSELDAWRRGELR
jgi:hypothetical protein